jgi:hypothetical protein
MVAMGSADGWFAPFGAGAVGAAGSALATGAAEALAAGTGVSSAAFLPQEVTPKVELVSSATDKTPLSLCDGFLSDVMGVPYNAPALALDRNL